MRKRRLNEWGDWTDWNDWVDQAGLAAILEIKVEIKLIEEVIDDVHAIEIVIDCALVNILSKYK